MSDIIEVKWENEDIQNFVDKATAQGALAGNEKCYVIFIGNKRYITPNGKGVWRKKNNASAAVTNHCKDIAKNIIRNKLQALMPLDDFQRYDFQRDDYYRQDAYKYALEHVLGILRANNMYEIRELDPHNIV